MLISRINNIFTFNEKIWLVSIINYEHQKIDSESSKASIIIEGIISQKLFFARYDIYAKFYENEKNKKMSNAFISHIDCFDNLNYPGYFKNIPSTSYYAIPIECENLSQQIKHIANIVNSKKTATSKTHIHSIPIRNACLKWCLDLLENNGLLYRETPKYEA